MAKIEQNIECMWCKNNYTWHWIIPNNPYDEIWDVEKVNKENSHAKLVEYDCNDHILKFVVICPHCGKDQLVICKAPIPSREYFKK